MKDSDYNQLRETGWRRRLTQAEQDQARDHLAAHPEILEDWELEAGLNRILEEMPDAPVPSNFTAQVLRAATHETTPARIPGRRWSIWRSLGWVPRMAVAALVLGLSGLSYHQYQVRSRAAMAQDVAQFSNVVLGSNPELMEDFDSIRRLSETQPKADPELLALMQ
ncbi:MAG TPA: hypothetical protein VH598_05015 [Verrucomicrobiae bacterium]|nr:hypothetical protein [Verrucomicrobiae bacterium]